ncbi:DUF4214 domain-containing protein [Tianweitania sediminis]|uniref:DUF4214 domain-containing protein n=1 Tax=Tianweitania sediminis TaxID=1502156 RepID=A0A8J7R107_9HYPH|nr:DUF4214 domain-containing protein [Tianweitania sediminis]MBP0439247.1 DUF4214 domain-containing protein [Tianweitania sediminis]
MLLVHTDQGRALIERLAVADPSFDTLFFANRALLGATIDPYFDQTSFEYRGSSYFAQIRYGYDAGQSKMFDTVEIFTQGFEKIASLSYINVPVAAGSLLYLDDKLYLTGADDNVYDGGGTDLVDLSDGDDIYHYLSGSDQVSGGNGRDVVNMTVPHGDVLVAKLGTAHTLTIANDAVVTLSGVERVAFSDGAALAFDIGAWSNAGAAYRLYQAAFDRVPEQAGLGFWIRALDEGRGDLAWVATNFIASAEFQQTYGTPPSVSDAAFVDLLYQNVLDRPAEGAGAEYWQAELAGGANRALVLLSFSESTENQAKVAAAIADGIWF